MSVIQHVNTTTRTTQAAAAAVIVRHDVTLRAERAV